MTEKPHAMKAQTKQNGKYYWYILYFSLAAHRVVAGGRVPHLAAKTAHLSFFSHNISFLKFQILCSEWSFEERKILVGLSTHSLSFSTVPVSSTGMVEQIYIGTCRPVHMEEDLFKWTHTYVLTHTGLGLHTHRHTDTHTQTHTVLKVQSPRVTPGYCIDHDVCFFSWMNTLVYSRTTFSFSCIVCG